jgi:hypothetical protein
MATTTTETITRNASNSASPDLSLFTPRTSTVPGLDAAQTEYQQLAGNSNAFLDALKVGLKAKAGFNQDIINRKTAIRSQLYEPGTTPEALRQLSPEQQSSLRETSRGGLFAELQGVSEQEQARGSSFNEILETTRGFISDRLAASQEKVRQLETKQAKIDDEAAKVRADARNLAAQMKLIDYEASKKTVATPDPQVVKNDETGEIYTFDPITRKYYDMAGNVVTNAQSGLTIPPAVSLEDYIASAEQKAGMSLGAQARAQLEQQYNQEYPVTQKPTKSQRTAIQPIASAFDNEQVVKNYNIAQEGYNTLKTISPDTKSPVDDITFIYGFAKVMDPNSVVREGEYNTIQKYAQNWSQTFGFNAKRIFSNTNFLGKDAKQKMLNALEAKFNSISSQYTNAFKEYGRRINTVTGRTDGTNYLTDYSKAFPVDDTKQSSIRVTAPNGKTYTFSSQEQANAFQQSF